MKYWLKTGLIGAGIGLLMMLIFFGIFFVGGERHEAKGLAFGAWLTITPLLILALFIIFAFAVIMKEKIKIPESTFTQKGFWIGLFLTLIILIYGGWRTWNGQGMVHGKEYLFYTLLSASLTLGGFVFIGWITQKIKEKTNWDKWSYTKKGFVIGLIASILVFIGVSISSTYWMYSFKKGFTDLINSGDLWILLVFIFIPVLICTIIGFIINMKKPPHQITS